MTDFEKVEGGETVFVEGKSLDPEAPSQGEALEDLRADKR